MLETNTTALANFKDIFNGVQKAVQHEITKHINSPEEKFPSMCDRREGRANLS
jgi:hypothetical protein